MNRAPLLVAGTIFGLVALIHVYRLYSHFNVVFGTTEIPNWASVVAAIVAGGLSWWMFSSACCCKKCDK
jgi:hypothetical protein